jgi:hypothetical protein
MNTGHRIIATTIGFVFSVNVYAHHGWAPHFDGNDVVSVEGRITKFEFVNPHSFVYVDVTNDAGEVVTHWCEMQARSQLQRRGIGEAQFKIGSTIAIQGFRSKRDPVGCELGFSRFHDGTELRLRELDGRGVFQAPLVEGDNSIIGTWYPEEFISEAGSEQDSQASLTPDGRAAHNAFDWLTQNPTLHCSPASNIRAWAAPGLPTSIKRENGLIRIRHEFMDAERVIYLDSSERASSQQRTDLGYSVGRFEDGALIIETTGFAAGALWAGRLNTEGLETTEKLWVDPATGLLVLEWTATDPAYYSAIESGRRTFVRTDLSIGNFECDSDAGHTPIAVE